jgi:hypothetical protein
MEEQLPRLRTRVAGDPDGDEFDKLSEERGVTLCVVMAVA